jgi:outer membrane protein assembly factor BamA
MAQLQGRLILKKGSIMDLFSKKYVSQKAIESDTMTILNILSLNGYNSPIITSNTSKNDEKGGNVLTWILSAGEKSLIEKITITGNSSLSDSEILSGIGVKNVISDSIIDQYKRRLSTLYKTKGYVNANIRISRRPVMTIDKDSEDRFDINIEIKENSVYRINGLSYEGNDVTRPRVFENELTFNIGEKYNHTKVTQSINKLYALDIFESVDIVTDIDENDELTLKIVVQEKDKLKKFSAGYNYDWTNKKHTGQLSIATTNFDISGITRIGKDGLSALSGNGQTFSGEFQVTDKSYVYGFSFYEPHILDTNFGLRVGLNHDQVSYTRDFTANDVTLPLYFDSNKTRGSIGLTAHVGDFSRVSLGLSGYKNGGNEDAEDYTYISYNASFSTRFINMKTSNLSLSLSTSKSKGLVYDRGTTQDGPNDDNTHFKGWTPEGFDVTDIRGSLNLAYYIPSGLKLKLNASTTQTFTPDDLAFTATQFTTNSGFGLPSMSNLESNEQIINGRVTVTDQANILRSKNILKASIGYKYKQFTPGVYAVVAALNTENWEMSDPYYDVGVFVNVDVIPGFPLQAGSGYNTFTEETNTFFGLGNKI